MLKEDKIALAVSVASACHFGQKDKGGSAYILHALRVMMQMDDEQSMIVAVLHDTVEDAVNWSVDMVRDQFGDRVAAAVDALTKREGESYDKYLSRVKGDEIATKVKLADLKDNSDLSRLGRDLTETDRKRLDKYIRARAILMEHGWVKSSEAPQ